MVGSFVGWFVCWLVRLLYMRSFGRSLVNSFVRWFYRSLFLASFAGRIDRKIEFPPPNEEARADILKIHSRKMNLTRGINLRVIAEMMPGASGETLVRRSLYE